MKIKKRYLEKIEQNIEIKLSKRIYTWIGKKYRMVEINNDHIGFVIIGYYYIDSSEVSIRNNLIYKDSLKTLIRHFYKNINILAEKCILFNKTYPGMIDDSEK